MFLRGAVVLVGLSSFAVSLARAASPCPEDPRYAAMAPWIGEWRMVEQSDDESRERGTTTVRWLLEGCAVEEVRQLADGSEHRALMHLDPLAGVWRELWVSSSGDAGLMTIEATEEGFRADGVAQLFTGGEIAVRARIAPRPDGGFSEEGEYSEDGWSTSRQLPATLYLPLDWAPPAVAEAPSTAAPELESAEAVSVPLPARPGSAPASSAPQDGRSDPAPVEAAQPEQPEAEEIEVSREPVTSVTVRSQRKDEAAVSFVELEAPMTLEFELGPVNLLPPGSGWRSTELEPFTAEDVNIPLVTAERRRKRKRHELLLTVNLRTTAFKRKVRIDAELIADDQPVGSASAAGIALGKMIGAHDWKTGRPVELVFDIEAGQLDQMFEDGRPSVRLTVGIE